MGNIAWSRRGEEAQRLIKRKIGEVRQDFLIGKFRNFSSPSTFDIILTFLEFRFV